MAIYECRECEREVLIPRRYTYHFGDSCRCPRCGTFRVVKLKTRDRIDPLHGGFLSLLERLSGGHRYHCCFCRVQFFDRRPLSPNSALTVSPEERETRTAGGAMVDDGDAAVEVHPEVAQANVTTPPDRANSGG